MLALSEGFVSVSSPSTGIYCLRAARSVDAAHSAPIVSQEQEFSSMLGFATVRRAGLPTPHCALDEIQVTMWSAANPATPTPVSTVGFDVVVP